MTHSMPTYINIDSRGVSVRYRAHLEYIVSDEVLTLDFWSGRSGNTIESGYPLGKPTYSIG